jgi:RHS repeat-associated protein
VIYACENWDGVSCLGNEWFYEYDGAGNLLRFDKWNTTTNTVETVHYIYNSANQIKCVDADASNACDNGEFEYVYDAYGNLINDGTSTYAYDAAMRLKQVTIWGDTTYYAYNGDGDRIAQTVGGVTTTYVIDTATPLTMVLAEISPTQTIRYWHGLDVIGQSDGVNVEYFGYDGLGSIRQLSDAGTVQLAQTFDPYGNGYSKSGSATTTLGYTGEQTDSNGFVFLRARYYNLAAGRFLNTDPSRMEQNPYQYGLGNPVNRVDPSGLCPPFPCLPTQDGSVSSPPTYTDANGKVHELEFSPWQGINPVVDSQGIPRNQFNIPGYEDTRGFVNFCGTVSVAAIVQNLLGINGHGVDQIVEILIKHDTNDTGILSEEDAKGTVGFNTLATLAQKLGLETEFSASSNKNDYDRYFSNEIRPKLNGRAWPIILITIEKIVHPEYRVTDYSVCTETSSPDCVNPIYHFVVISGLSRREQWKKGREWQWVRIFNPINNGAQYYLADELFKSQSPARTTLWLSRIPSPTQGGQ